MSVSPLAGQTDIKRRSLQSGHEGYTTFLFQADWTMERPGYVFGFLRRRFDEDTVNQIGRMRLTADQKGAVFDLPAALVDAFVAKCAPLTARAPGGAGPERTVPGSGRPADGGSGRPRRAALRL